MKVVLAMVLAGLVALPLGASAQGGEESTEPNVEEPAPPSEPAPEQPPPSPEPTAEEPALQLELDAAGVKVTPIPPRTPDGYTLEEMNVRVRRAKFGFGVSSVALFAGLAMGLAALGGSLCSFGEIFEDDPSCPPPWLAPVGATGAVLGIGGLAGVIASGVMLKRRRRELQLRYHEAVDVDTSDDAFLVIVTRKYERGQLIGATAFIKHNDSGQYANPYIHAAEMDSLDQVIREHKAKLLSGE